MCEFYYSYLKNKILFLLVQCSKTKQEERLFIFKRKNKIIQKMAKLFDKNKFLELVWIKIIFLFIFSEFNFYSCSIFSCDAH